MKFQGERRFALPPTDLFSRLADARFLVACIPDSQPGPTPTAERATTTVRPGFSFLRGSLEVELTRAEAVEPTRLVYTVISKGVGSQADVRTEMELTPDSAGTKVVWNAEVTKLGGLLKLAPSALMKAAAHKVIDDVWAGIDRALTP